jgi:serine/threonine-protein kinase RsbW
MGPVITRSHDSSDSRSANAVAARLPATRAAVAEAIGLARGFAAGADLPVEAAEKLAIIAEEWVANIIEHGVLPAGSHIGFALERGDDAVRVTVTDTGVAYDPRDATFEGPNEERGGGVGLALISAWCRIADYRRLRGRNRVVFELAVE